MNSSSLVAFLFIHTCDEQRSSPICAQRTYSTSLPRSASPEAALKQPLASQPTLPYQMQEVHVDDLPISSIGDHKVAVGWDTRTWSRLCVSLFFVRSTSGLIADMKSSYMVTRPLSLSEMLPHNHETAASEHLRGTSIAPGEPYTM